MKSKFGLTVTLSIAVIIIGLVLNFPEYLSGSEATIKNFVVTIIYVAVWILVLIIGVKYKSISIIKYSSIFWGLMLFISMVTIYILVTGAYIGWILPMAILLNGQWYGVNFLADNFTISSIIVAIISSIMFLTSIIYINIKFQHISLKNHLIFLKRLGAFFP